MRDGGAREVSHRTRMIDLLLARALLPLEGCASIREQRRLLQRQFDHELVQLRMSVLESAMSRAECKAQRDNRDINGYPSLHHAGAQSQETEPGADSA